MGLGGGHLHGQVLGKRLDFGRVHALGLAAGQEDQHADLAVGVDVLSDDFIVGLAGMARELAELHVFAHRGDELLDLVAHHAVQGGGISRIVLQHGLGHAGGHVLELIAAGHEVGFAHQRSHGHVLAVRAGHGGDHAFAGGAAGLFGGLGHALLAQPVHGLFQVAVHFHQGFLAVHHAAPVFSRSSLTI